MISPLGLLGIGITAASGSGGGQSYPELVLADGAIGYWKLNETSGTVATDTAGTLDAAYFNGISSVTGLVDGDTAVDLTSDRYVRIDDSDQWSPITHGAFTFECWVKLDSGPATQRIIARKKVSSSEFYMLTSSTLALSFRVGSGTIVPGGTLSTDTWYHLVGTWEDSGTCYLYVNGSVVDSRAAGAAAANSSDRVFLSETLYDLNGSIQHVAIYPTQLSGAQVLAHYELGAGI